MAYDEYMADRVRNYLTEQNQNFYEKKMMGGLCFMVNDKMFCGVHYDKKKESDLLMARVGPEAYEEALNKKGSLLMDFTGRPMKGFVFVKPEGFDLDKDLYYWLNLCLDYNPLAKASKKKKKASKKQA